MREVLMRRGGNQGLVRRNRSGNMTRMNKNLPIEQSSHGRDENGMVGEPVEALQLLYVVVSLDADAVVSSQDFFSREAVDGLDIDQAEKWVLIGREPAIFLKDSEYFGSQGQNRFMRQ